MKIYSHSAEDIALLKRAQWQRTIIEREEKERARWKYTGSREGLEQFRRRIAARQETATVLFNYLLIGILVIIIWENLRKLLFPKEVKQVNNALQEESEERRILSNMHRAIKLRKLDMSPHFGLPLYRQEVLIEEVRIIRKNDKLNITGISPSLFCDKGGIQIQIQCNQVLSALAKPMIVFEARDEEEVTIKPIQFDKWESSLDSVVTILPRQHLEIQLSSGRIRAYIKIQDNGEDSEPRKINFKPHSKEACICTSEFNIFTPGVSEEVREVALLAQSVRKLPISRRKPQTLYNTIFQIDDMNLRNFVKEIAGNERMNTLYEILSMVSNYCDRNRCWVEHNNQAVICNRSLDRALGFGGFLWTDLAQLLIDKAKISPASRAQMLESNIRLPTPQ